MLIPYPISVDYMHHWTKKQAIREVLQNAIDSGEYFVRDDFGSVKVINRLNEPVAKKDLLWLGCSNKSPNAIGKYGEGLKLALLVLARAGIGHYFKTPNYTISGSIINEQFHVDVVETEGLENTAEFFIDDEDAIEIIDSLLLNRKKYKVVCGDQGNYCIDLPGHVYVNGLLVTTNAKTQYGYNFKPSALNLDRDRQTVAEFDLTWETSKLLALKLEPEIVAELMYKNIKDVNYVSNFASQEIKQACRDYLVNIYGKDVLVANNEEEAKIWRLFNPRRQVVVRSGGFGTLVRSSNVGEKGITIKVPSESPSAIMADFYERNKKHLRSKALQEFKYLVQASTQWTKK